jgi:hypothetical protein
MQELSDTTHPRSLKKQKELFQQQAVAEEQLEPVYLQDLMIKK